MVWLCMQQLALLALAASPVASAVDLNLYIGVSTCAEKAADRSATLDCEKFGFCIQNPPNWPDKERYMKWYTCGSADDRLCTAYWAESTGG